VSHETRSYICMYINAVANCHVTVIVTTGFF